MVRIPSQFLKPRSNQAGFTIIESLMAIIVVAILLVAVTPAITLSVAMRVQSKRVEQATQAARTYIDGVRTYNVSTATGTIAPPAHAINLASTGTAASNAALLNNVAPPAVNNFPSGVCATTSATNAYCSGKDTAGPPGLSLYCVDRDGDGACTVRSNQDFIIQAFRSANVNSTVTDVSNQRSYLLAVRVYRADAFNTARNPANLRCNAPTANCNNTAGAKVTQQTGYNLGDNRRGSPLISSKAPLVEMVTEVNDPNSATFRDMCRRLANTNATNTVGSATINCP